MNPTGQPHERDPDFSLHGLSITPERPAVKAEPLPAPAAGFTFVRELGRGGMGVVYAAREDATGRQVAVKVIAQRLGGNADAVERFEREARLAASISHPNCVFVYGAHAVHGAAAISMELMTGQTLEDRLRSKDPVPVETAVQWAVEILDGLAAAHELEIVHRDIKPSNCFLTSDGHVKVGDFGLSRSIGGDLALTQSGAFLGSPLFASPEQVRGRALDQRTDIYSAGATLYALLAGRPPHSGSALGDVLAQIVSEEPPALESLRPGLPRGLARVVAKALAKDPAKRFQDCSAFRRALLPYGPGSLTPATLGLRIGGYFLDMMMMSTAYQGACAVLYFSGVAFHGTAPGAPWMPTESLAARIIPTVFSTMWFASFEWAFGATPLRRLLGLRVVAIDGTPVPFWRAALRSAVFSAPYAIPTFIFGIDTSLLGMVRLAAYLVPMITMRRRNAYRGAHEFASGTRTLRVVPLGTKDRSPPPLDPPRPRVPELATSIGPYVIEGLVGSTPSGQVVTARDQALGRSVWIHAGLGAGPPHPPARASGSPGTPWPASAGIGGVAASRSDAGGPAVLHWLGHGDEGGGYEVYESPGGASLAEYEAAGHRISWTAGLARLRELVDALTGRDAVALEQIWIDRGGRLRVLDFPVGKAPATTRSPVELVGAVARVLLLGRDPESSIPLGLPVHAEAPLRRILGVDPPFETLTAVREALEHCALQRTDVSTARRAGQIAIAGVWFAMLVTLIFIAAHMGAEEIAKKNASRRGMWPSDIALMSTVMLVFPFFAPSVIMAFILRGGITFSILGIRVRRRSGALASRWWCLLRSLVVCLPILPLAAVGYFMERPGSWPLVWGTIAGGAIAYIAGIVIAIRHPTDGLVDKIARTRLVAR